MSDEQRKDEAEVEAHNRSSHANIEPAAETEDDDVEAHVRKTNARMDSPRHI